MTDSQLSRVLIYSHDSFGLGHLRRCRTIAHSLVEQYKSLSVLIISGSPIIGSFDFRARVDFVRVPGVIKLHSGEYTSLALHIDLKHTLELRESIIMNTARVFAPDIFLVDKEPTGLQGEVVETLAMLQQQGCVNILGLRDVMDDPESLKLEWDRKGAVDVIQNSYDAIWVYGPPEMGNPVDSIDLDPEVMRKLRYTGYLRRQLPVERVQPDPVDTVEPYFLITTGGGGDGVEVVDWVLRTYESEPDIPFRAIIVHGPFMPAEKQLEFNQRAEALGCIDTITFDNNIELLMKQAEGIVAMGGYNTFCEILSFDKKALIIPRSKPRKEQLVRANNAAALGLVQVLDPEQGMSTGVMAEALRNLPRRPYPSRHMSPRMLDGLERIANLVEPVLASATRVVAADSNSD